MMIRRRRAHGFTLLEVMIALAILAAALVVLLRMSSQDVRASYRAKLLTIATQLARSKMNDLEEELVKNGFTDTAEDEHGDFGDEGQKKFRWDATIEKVVLPQSDKLASDTAAAGKDKDAAAKAGVPAPSGAQLNQQQLLDLAGGSSTGAMGAGMVQMYFPIISPILENAIRKVTLSVKWKIGDEEETLKTICFFTDTKAIDLAMPGAAVANAAADASKGTTTGTSSNTNNGSGTNK